MAIQTDPTIGLRYYKPAQVMSLGDLYKQENEQRKSDIETKQGELQNQQTQTSIDTQKAIDDAYKTLATGDQAQPQATPAPITPVLPIGGAAPGSPPPAAGPSVPPGQGTLQSLYQGAQPGGPPVWTEQTNDKPDNSPYGVSVPITPPTPEVTSTFRALPEGEQAPPAVPIPSSPATLPGNGAPPPSAPATLPGNGAPASASPSPLTAAPPAAPSHWQDVQTGAAPPPVTVQNGVPRFSADAIGAILAKNGFGHAAPAVMKALNDAEESAGKVREQKSKLAGEEADYAGNIAAAARSAGDDRDVLLAGLVHGVGLYGRDSNVGKVLNKLAANPQAPVTPLIDQLLAGSPKQRELQNQTTTAKAAQTHAEVAQSELTLKQLDEARKQQQFPTQQRKEEADADTAEANATIKKASVQLMQHPEVLTQAVDGLFPGDTTGIAARTKDLIAKQVQFGQTDEALKTLTSAVEASNAPGKAVLLEKVMGPLRVAEDVAKFNATAPQRQAEAVQTANINRANSGATKLDDAYNKALQGVETANKIIELAESGNKAAAGQQGIVTAEMVNAAQGFHRINRTDIETAGGSQAGTAWDRLTGFWDKATVGQPIPKGIEEDMRASAQAVGEAAYDTYIRGLKSLEARAPGVKLPPTLPAPQVRPKTTGPQVGDVVSIGGKNIKITALHPDGTFDGDPVKQ